MNLLQTLSCQAEKWLLAERRKGGLFVSGVLYVCSLFFLAASRFRNFLFDRAILPTSRVNKLVVSIGNIIAGGSGKTPFTHRLATDVGEPLLLLHRGYRAEKSGEGEEVESPSQGDEAFLLKQKLPHAKVVRGKNRAAIAKKEEGGPSTYILLDDGMQHRYLHRDVEIVVLHARALFGGGHFLPRGLLRESPKNLKRADAIFLNGVKSEEEFTLAARLVQQYSKAPIFGGAYTVVNREEIAGKSVGAFCGIGQPEEFFSLLKGLGCQIVKERVLADHEPFLGAIEFIQEALNQGAECVVCTEKDYVKVGALPHLKRLCIEVEILYGRACYEDLVKNIRTLSRKASVERCG